MVHSPAPWSKKTQQNEGSSVKNGHTIANVNSFPCKIRQQTKIWCIPAVVEAVMKYLDPNEIVDQKLLVEEYVKTEEFKTISYESLRDSVLIPKFGSEFCFFIEVRSEFEEWKSAVQKYVRLDLPPLVSIRAGNDFHMNAILGFTKSLFMTYDPAAGCKPVPIEKFKGNHQPDILIIKRLSRNSSKETANL